MEKILVVETGGTFATESLEGIRSLNKKGVGIYDKEPIKERKEKYNIEFEVIRPLYTLSENMTFFKENQIIDTLRKVDFSKYIGIILTHGTDTMAYTANTLSMLFSNKSIPIVLVGANHPINMEISNGVDNFKSAVDFIVKVKVQGVYVIYKNARCEIQVHLGSRIKQTDQTVDTYNSYRNSLFGYIQDEEFIKTEIAPKLEELNKKKENNYSELKFRISDVLMLIPYVGLRYDLIDISKFDAVILGVYHSGTLNTDNEEAQTSVNTLFKKAKELNIPVFISEVVSNIDVYESTETIEKLDNVHYIYDTSMENLYVKLNLGLPNLNKDELIEYLNKDIFFEKVLKK